MPCFAGSTCSQAGRTPRAKTTSSLWSVTDISPRQRCYLQRGDYLSALSLLGHLLEYFEQYDRTLDKIEALVLLAICRYRMDGPDWREHLASALELAGEYGYVRVFAHLGAPLLPVLQT